MPRYLLKHRKPEAVLASVVLYILEDEFITSSKSLGGNIVDNTSECDRAGLFFTVEFNQCSVV